MEVGLSSGQVVLDGGPSCPTERCTAEPPLFGPCVYCGQMVAHLSYCYFCFADNIETADLYGRVVNHHVEYQHFDSNSVKSNSSCIGSVLRSVVVTAGCVRQSLFSFILTVLCSTESSRRLVRAWRLRSDVDGVMLLTGTATVADSKGGRIWRPPGGIVCTQCMKFQNICEVGRIVVSQMNKTVQLRPQTLQEASFPNQPSGAPPLDLAPGLSPD